MARQVSASQPTEPLEYVYLEGNTDEYKTVISMPNHISSWIDPNMLKLKHRIGRGPFGDVWIATHHLSAGDYDECHEVAVKMLNSIRQDQMQTLLAKFDELFLKCQGLHGICLLHGISYKNGNVYIAMKFYEGSVGDKMAHLKGGRISVVDVLRYGIDLAHGILELHKRGVLVLNLKPCNFLLDEHDQVILGDFGIPSLLLGISLSSTDMIHRLGTPNYMAPEQWQPDVRGPISFETDSWGFGCSIVEMLNGIQPWSGRSADEICQLVVIKQEKPKIPGGLPPAMENVLRGCFEYDLRNRPLMEDILRVFKSCKDTVSDDGSWGGRVSKMAYTDWSLSKDQLQVGDTVRSRMLNTSCKPESMEITKGTIVGLDSNADVSGFVLVRVHGIHDPVRVHSSTLERVTSNFAPGEWVCMRTGDEKHSPVGILHSIGRDGTATASFIGLEGLWKGNSSELCMAGSYRVGQFVRVKAEVSSPRFEWPAKRISGGGDWATGRISQILPNGCLIVRFPGRLRFGDAAGDGSFFADPAEVEVVSFSTCEGVAKKYQHLEDFHWAVRPLMIALGLFTAVKLGILVGKKAGRSRRKGAVIGSSGGGNLVVVDRQQPDGHNSNTSSSSNTAWLPPAVGNILFKD